MKILLNLPAGRQVRGSCGVSLEGKDKEGETTVTLSLSTGDAMEYNYLPSGIATIITCVVYAELSKGRKLHGLVTLLVIL